MSKISFIMPAWKGAYLREAVGSILAQTSTDWELVVVDDCSPEPLREIVESFGDLRIRYERNERNLGGKNLVQQWNHCITFATGDYIVLAADDDIYRPGFCKACLELAAKYPQADLIHSSVEQIDGNGLHLEDDNILPEFTSKYEYLNWWVTGRLFTCVGNFAFKRSAIEALGGFIDFPCGFGSDVATPIALSHNGVANTQEMLFCFRQSDNHLSADTSRFEEKLEAFSQLSEWLRAIDYEEPESPEDKAFYSVMNPGYLQRKVVYEYFNLVLRYVPAGKLCHYLRLCRLATPAEKFMMVLRKIKLWLHL
ncbi:MAG: glycosyltransferase family 2 protein [Bacteroidales bacterium]|nr:glycosyltransferase family 2 protein [Bacteroidales bacterium]